MPRQQRALKRLAPPRTVADVLDWLAALPDADRARVGSILADGATTAAVAADRRRTIYRMTRTASYDEVAAALKVSRSAIAKAVTEYGRTVTRNEATSRKVTDHASQRAGDGEGQA